MAADAEPSDEGRKRRWSIPPAPERRRAELEILRDVDGALALTLWRAARDVYAWVEATPAGRACIAQEPSARVRERWAHAARQAPELAGALDQLALLLGDGGGVQPRPLAGACAQVAEWAEERALVETAVQFGEAAAAVEPESPAWANLAGRVCKRAALHDRAEAWYQRGIGFARRRKDDVEYINARLGYGGLLYDLGRHKDAEDHFLKAARRAATSGRRVQAAETQHDLLTLYGESGTLQQVIDYAEAALHNYPLHHRRVPFLAHDLARFVNQHGRWMDAYPLVSQAVRLIPLQDQALAWGTLAWAAAGAALRDEYEAARQQGENLAALYPEYTPATLYHIAEGAALLGDWDESERLAAHALKAAQMRSDGRIIAETLRLLDRIGTRSTISGSGTYSVNRRLTSLLVSFSHRLRVWKPE